MALWTDIVDPQTLTGYARASLADYEARKGTLARWLPNRYVADVVVRFVQGQTGLIDMATFRAYDAEIEVGRRAGGKRITLELPALGQEIPVSEYEQLRARGGNVSDEEILVSIENTTDAVVRAVSDRIEALRGTVLASGRATIAEERFKSDDDFARPTAHQLVATNLWSTASVSRLDYLRAISDTYTDTTGELAGTLLMSTRVFRALASGSEFQTQLLNGGARNATQADVNDLIAAAGLPPITLYDRRVASGGIVSRAFPDNVLALLPEAVDPDDFGGTDLGATFWGRTLTSTDTAWSIEDAEQPGIVAGVYRGEKPPMIAEVMADAIAMPVLANAAKSLVAQVL